MPRTGNDPCTMPCTACGGSDRRVGVAGTRWQRTWSTRANSSWYMTRCPQMSIGAPRPPHPTPFAPTAPLQACHLPQSERAWLFTAVDGRLVAAGATRAGSAAQAAAGVSRIVTVLPNDAVLNSVTAEVLPVRLPPSRLLACRGAHQPLTPGRHSKRGRCTSAARPSRRIHPGRSPSSTPPLVSPSSLRLSSHGRMGWPPARSAGLAMHHNPLKYSSA